jgi:hypothetical protein
METILLFLREVIGDQFETGVDLQLGIICQGTLFISKVSDVVLILRLTISN